MPPALEQVVVEVGGTQALVGARVRHHRPLAVGATRTMQVPDGRRGSTASAHDTACLELGPTGAAEHVVADARDQRGRTPSVVGQPRRRVGGGAAAHHRHVRGGVGALAERSGSVATTSVIHWPTTTNSVDLAHRVQRHRDLAARTALLRTSATLTARLRPSVAVWK